MHPSNNSPSSTYKDRTNQATPLALHTPAKPYKSYIKLGQEKIQRLH